MKFPLGIVSSGELMNSPLSSGALSANFANPVVPHPIFHVCGVSAFICMLYVCMITHTSVCEGERSAWGVFFEQCPP